MTGEEKIKQMLDSGEFAEFAEEQIKVCPKYLGLPDYCLESCSDCWRKALESEVE